MLLFGQNNFAVRLPSALAVGLSAILIFLLAARATDKEETPSHGIAALATIIFLTCFEVFGVGNTAVLDNLFTLFLTTASWPFLRPPKTTRDGRGKGLASAGRGVYQPGLLNQGVLGLCLAGYRVRPFSGLAAAY